MSSPQQSPAKSPGPPQLSTFLTTWFLLDASINILCAPLFFFNPALYYSGLPPPSPPLSSNLIFTTRTQSTYFAIAGCCMITAAFSKCAETRRRLAMCFILPGVILQLPAVIVRMRVGDGGWGVWVGQLAGCVGVVVPYLWFAVVKPEGTPKTTGSSSSSSSTSSTGGESDPLLRGE